MEKDSPYVLDSCGQHHTFLLPTNGIYFQLRLSPWDHVYSPIEETSKEFTNAMTPCPFTIKNVLSNPVTYNS